MSERQTTSVHLLGGDGRPLSTDEAESALGGNTAKEGLAYASIVSYPDLLVLSPRAIRREGDLLRTELPAAGEALAVNLQVDHGYSLVFLEPGDLRFTDAGELDLVLSVVERYGDRLQSAGRSRGIEVEPPDSFQGRGGLTALDRAYLDLLTTYGVRRAREQEDPAWIAVTINSLDGADGVVDLAARATGADLGGSESWIRLPFATTRPFADYDEVVDASRAAGLRILGQAVDSTDFYHRKLTVEQYVDRYRSAAAHFDGRVDAWEVGSEVNAPWVMPTGQVVEKVEAATKALREVTEVPLSISLLFKLATAQEPFEGAFSFLADYPELVKELDGVLLSAYPDMSPLGLGFDEVMSAFAGHVPAGFIGLGELGYWHYDGRTEESEYFDWERGFWSGTRIAKTAPGEESAPARVEIADTYYRAALGYPRSIGGCFWWDFVGEAPVEAELVQAIRGVAADLSG